MNKVPHRRVGEACWQAASWIAVRQAVKEAGLQLSESDLTNSIFLLK